MSNKVEILEAVIGQVPVMIDGAEPMSDLVTICFESGERWQMWHEQDCCESVWLEDVCGDPIDLVGSPLTQAEVVSENCEDCDESGTWTFYKFATIKGSVTLRWLGESNGFYSEYVDFCKV